MLLQITDTLGHLTKQFYDIRNRLVKEVDAFGHETKSLTLFKAIGLGLGATTYDLTVISTI